MAASIHFQYAVYMMPRHLKDPSAVLRSAIAGDFRQLKLVEQLPEEPKEMLVHARIETNVRKQYVPPTLDALKYSGFGLSAAQAQSLQNSEEAFILEFAHPEANVWVGLRNASQLIEKIARETHRLVWDEETREVFSPDAWHEPRLGTWQDGAPEISSQTVIHMYENGEFVRAVTLGMSKAGLPDVVIELASSSETQVGNLINVFSQSLAEGVIFRKSGRFKIDLSSIKNVSLRDAQLKSFKDHSVGVACATVRIVVREEGDSHNRLVGLTFDEYPGNDAHAKQEAAFSSFFGWEDSITAVRHTDELLEASRKGKSNLPKLHHDFDVGFEPDEFIMVKAPFKTTDGGNEWMWVEIRTWKGHVIKGLLENEPDQVPGLHTGQMVEVREDDIFDYMRHYADKHEEGNTTGEVITKMERNKAGRKPIANSQTVPECQD